MSEHIRIRKREVSRYKSAISEEDFLFYEMRVAAELAVEGYTDDTIVDLIVENNLFQYHTEDAERRMAWVCLECLHGLPDWSMEEALANQPTDVARQIALYATMRHYRLIWDFMVNVIGEKYRTEDLEFRSSDLDAFFQRVKAQEASSWAWDAVDIVRVSQVIMRILVENKYLDDLESDRLEPIWLYPLVEQGIRRAGEADALPAFNCFTERSGIWF